MVERVCLILKGKRFEVNKEKVASKSRYFESLFSDNFNDFRKKEHIIHYDIDLATLENFIEWVHDDSRADTCCRFLKVSMTKFANGDFAGLLNLLELSVLYAADELTSDIVDVIVLHWLSPEKVIDIWLLADELNVRVLRDICMSFCLDHFIGLPTESLFRLAKDQFSRLINNVNRRSSTTYANCVRREWSTYHNTTLDAVYSRKKKRRHVLYGTAVYQRDERKAKNGGGKIGYVYIWNDNSRELVKLPEAVNYLVGMQFVGKGFSIYLVGGETGFGTGKFNKRILRYCLLSKKWYYYATLPSPRRHMIAAFVEGNLILVGGVGKHRLKLETVDVLDIQTGEWKRGEPIPETFTEVPPHCVVGEALFYLKSALYVYRLTNTSGTSPRSYLHSIPMNYSNLPVLLTREATLLFADVNNSGEIVFTSINVEPACEQENCLENNVEHRPISYDDQTLEEIPRYNLDARSAHLELENWIYSVMMIVPPEEELRFHIRTEVNDVLNQIDIIPRGTCFELADPRSLYDINRD